MQICKCIVRGVSFQIGFGSPLTIILEVNSNSNRSRTRIHGFLDANDRRCLKLHDSRTVLIEPNRINCPWKSNAIKLSHKFGLIAFDYRTNRTPPLDEVRRLGSMKFDYPDYQMMTAIGVVRISKHTRALKQQDSTIAVYLPLFPICKPSTEENGLL